MREDGARIGVPSTAADLEREAMYNSGAERHAARLREEARREWARFHTNMSRLHARLSEDHQERAAALHGEEDSQ